jgi:hypothetical protein
MALARVVSFEGVGKDRIETMQQEMREGERPEEVPATEVIVLHDPESEKALAILFFDTEDDYGRGDEAAHVGDEVRRRHSHDRLTDASPGSRPCGSTRPTDALRDL